MTTTTIATKDHWDHTPILKPKRLDIELNFSEEQYSLLKAGLLPDAMEDKWFIYCEDDTLHCHRSWTGYGIYEAKLVKTTEGYSIKEFLVERDAEHYLGDDDHDRGNFMFLIAQGLLHIDVRDIYFKHNVPSDVDTVRAWGEFGRMMFGQ
jgi:hypothetical protein